MSTRTPLNLADLDRAELERVARRPSTRGGTKLNGEVHGNGEVMKGRSADTWGAVSGSGKEAKWQGDQGRNAEVSGGGDSAAGAIRHDDLT